MKSSTRNAVAAVAFTVIGLCSAATGHAAPADPAPVADPQAPMPMAGVLTQGEDAMMAISKAMYGCMMREGGGVPRAIANDRGVMFYCANPQ
ncbi:MAG: hypothetical protein HYZ38_14365 [Mycobacterium sp.]|nr:hypothetical protein [Mycobacterium sp.]